MKPAPSIPMFGYQAFVQTRFLGPTNNRCARVRATNVTSQRAITVAWDHGVGTIENHLAAAYALYSAMAEDGGVPAPAHVLACGTADSCGYVFTAYPTKSV